MSMQDKIKKTKGLTKNQQKALESLSEEEQLIFSGVGGGRNIDPEPDIVARPGEHVQQYGSSYYKLGSSISGIHPASGYGGQGDPLSHSHRLVAGGGGPDVLEESSLGERMVLGSDPIVDSATILISSKHSRSAEDFGLTIPKGTKKLPGSIVALKANELVLNADAGNVKIVTSTNAYNSQGGKNISVGSIILSPGDGPEEGIEPIAKGERLKKKGEALFKRLDDLEASVTRLTTYQAKMNKTLTNHYHHSPLFGVPTSVSFDTVLAGIQNAVNITCRHLPSLQAQRMKGAMQEKQFLSQAGKEYINSGQVKIF